MFVGYGDMANHIASIKQTFRNVEDLSSAVKSPGF